MATVSIRELRNHGGDVLDRVERGETLTVTRAGRPVAELRPLPRKTVTTVELLERWKHVPRVDPAELRADLDAIIDPRLWPDE